MKLPLWSSLGVFRGSRNAPLNGGATAKRCGGDGKAHHEMTGQEPSPQAGGDETGNAQRVPLSKIGVVIQRTSCGAQYLSFLFITVSVRWVTEPCHKKQNHVMKRQ